MPRRALPTLTCEAPSTTRSILLARAKARAAGILWSRMRRSFSIGWSFWRMPRPPGGNANSGTTIWWRSSETSMVTPESMVSARAIMPVHRPENRDIEMPSRP